MFKLFLAIQVIVVGFVSAYKRNLNLNMPEYARFDPQVYTYDLISEEDIWEHGLVTDMGVINMTAEVYMERLYNAPPPRPNDKPWYICMVETSKHNAIVYSTYLMKSLYFMQRDFSEKAHYAFINAGDEYIREAFDYEFVPSCFFVKDRKPYYVSWDVLSINTIQEFMIRYEELS